MANERDNAILGQKVRLQIQYFDVNGDSIQPDETPTFRIVDSTGEVIQDYTDEDVLKTDDGLYEVEYEVPSSGSTGMWMDEWRAVIGEQTLDTIFVFTVVDANTGVEPTTGPGKIKIGDEVVFDFSDEEIYGINILLKYLKARLRSNGTKPKRDQFGKFIYDGYGELVTEECNVFDDEALVAFLCQGLSEFNMVPFFTAYTFASQEIQTLFSQAIVEGAYIMALAAQSILEKGRDFTISDGGISFTPPQMGDFLSTHYNNWLSNYRERLKFIKNSIRPGPQGFGSYSTLGSRNTQVARLRHIRSRRII